MFDLKAFITTNIINGIKNGTFSKEYGNIMAVNYLAKGMLTETEVEEIDTAITAWEQEQVASEPIVEEPTTEPVEETTTDSGTETTETTAETAAE